MIIPTVNEMTIINLAALSIFRMPNSRSKTTNVAIQGKYVANIIQEIVNCCGLISKGNNMPIAISFLRKYIQQVHDELIIENWVHQMFNYPIAYHDYE